MAKVRGALVGVGLVVPPAVLAVAVWPEPGPSAPEPSGEAFVDPVVDRHVVELAPDGRGVTIVLQPSPEGVGACLEVRSGNGGSGSCGTLADLGRFPSGGGGSSNGVTSTIEVVGLAPAEADSLVLTLEDGTEIEGVVVELPGRPEKVYAAFVTVEGDAFSGPSMGIEARLLDEDGEVVEEGSL